MTSDGGEKAAFGFRYQYLVTVEDFLQYLVQRPGHVGSAVLVVEAAGPSDDDDDEVVDYSIVVEDAVVRRVQVKGTRAPSGLSPFRPGDAKAIFDRMAQGPRASTTGVVRTNKPASKKLSAKWKRTERQDIPLDQYEYPQRGADTAEYVVEFDKRSTHEVKQSLLALVRQIRSNNALGLGAKSAALLMAVILDRVFESAAGMSERTISASSLMVLLGTHDNALAHALGEYDWGAALVEVPRLTSPVPRMDDLVELSDLFDASVTTRNPKVAVLSGVTGFGKSTIAADFCQLNRHLYEKVVWIDCRETNLIEGKVRDVLRRLDIEFDENSDVPDLFRTALGNLGGPVVVVFDGARDREQIQQFVPTSGCGFVVVTTTNSATWWPSAVRRQVGAFSTEEAVQCFASYADVGADEHREAITNVVDRLERVPLAIAMAGLYFRDSGDDIASLTDDYFARLDALDDPAFRPESFDRTAFAAVKLAVERLAHAKAGSSEDRLQAQALVYHSSFLAPELIPFNMILQTVEAENMVDLARPPRPTVADRYRRNVIMANLQTQTIARRRQYVERPGDEGPASDTLNIHPLVHEILRSIHTRGVSDRDLLGLLTGLMGCVYGWLEEMRAHGEFFPVDQLLLHSDHLLSVVDGLNLTEAPDEEKYVYRCAQAFLLCETANGHSSRGQYEISVSMIERVLEDIADLTLSPHAQVVIAKAAADAVTDVLLGGLGVDRARPIAERALQEVTQLEAIEQQAAGEMAYLCATETLGALQKFDSPDVAAIVRQLEEVADRQMRTPSATGIIQAIVADLKAGRLHGALRKIDEGRRRAPTAPNLVIFDQYAATAFMHLGRFDEAADAIERIVDADSSQHMAFMFRSMYVALDTGLTSEYPKWRRSRAASRLGRLHAEVKRRKS